MRLAPTSEAGCAVSRRVQKHNMMCFYRQTHEYLNPSHNSTAIKGLLMTDRRPLNPMSTFKSLAVVYNPVRGTWTSRFATNAAMQANLAKIDTSKASRQLVMLAFSSQRHSPSAYGRVQLRNRSSCLNLAPGCNSI